MMLPAKWQKPVSTHFNITLFEFIFDVEMQFFCTVPWHFFTDRLYHFFDGNSFHFFLFNGFYFLIISLFWNPETFVQPFYFVSFFFFLAISFANASGKYFFDNSWPVTFSKSTKISCCKSLINSNASIRSFNFLLSSF